MTKKYGRNNYFIGIGDFNLPISKKIPTFASQFKTPETPRSVKSERIYNFHCRQLDFIEAVNKLWKKSHSNRPNLQRLCALAAASPAPRFYVTPRHALDEYGDYTRTGVICRENAIAKEMYRCIFERYERALADSNGVEFKYAIMQNVLDEPAPSFYLSPKAAYAYYCNAMAYKRSLSRK